MISSSSMDRAIRGCYAKHATATAISTNTAVSATTRKLVSSMFLPPARSPGLSNGLNNEISGGKGFLSGVCWQASHHPVQRADRKYHVR